MDGERFLSSELAETQDARINKMDSVPTELVHAPWLASAMEQMGIENY